MAKYKHTFQIASEHKDIFLSSLEIFHAKGVLAFSQLTIGENDDSSTIITCISEYSVFQRDIWQLFPYAETIKVNEQIL